LEIDKKLRLLAVKVSCKNERGSGVLIQPETNEYSYVITARHCIEGDIKTPQEYNPEDIIIEGEIQTDTSIPIKGINCYFHKNEAVDLAIVKIPYIPNLTHLYIENTKFKDECAIYGYPEPLEEEVNERDIIYADVSDNASKAGRIEIKIKDKQESTGQRTSNNIQGFSGSGIFGLEGEISLYGIFVELKDKYAVYNTYCGFNVRCIEEIVEEEGIAKLFHYKLTTFERFLEEALKPHRQEINTVLRKIFREQISLTPIEIIEQIGDMLAIPHNKKCILVDKLWEGWAKLIILLHIIGIDISSVGKICYEKEDIENYIKMLYSDECKRAEEVIHEIFTNREILEEVINNSVIVLNTASTFHGKFLGRQRVKNIVENINSCIRYENGIDISDPDCSRNLSIIHIDKFGDDLEDNIDGSIDCWQVEEEIKKIVRGILDDAIK
jgi:hypothetical protein